MKWLRILLFTLGGCIALVVLVGAIGLLPSVQTWATRKVVTSQPGMDIAVGRVAAGFNSAKVNTVIVAQPGARLKVDSVEVDYSVWDYLVHDQLKVQRLVIDGVELDLREPGSAPAETPDPTQEDATIFNGVLQAAELPVDLLLASLSARGRVLLPEGREATFELQGTDIVTGGSGSLSWTVTYRDAAGGAAVQAVRSEGQAKIRIAANRRMEAVSVVTTTTLEGPDLPADRIRAEVVAEAQEARTGTGENYSARLSLLRNTGDGGQETDETLLSSEATFEPATRTIAGSWNLAARSELLGAILAGLGLPDLDLQGAGRFAVEPDTGAASASGEVDTRVARLAAISPELAPIGAVQVKLGFDGAVAEDTARLLRFEIDAIDAEGRTFAQVRNLQRIGFNLVDQRIDVPDPQEPLVRFALSDIPLAWAQPWLSEQRIESGRLSTVLTVTSDATGQEIGVRASVPVTLNEVTVWQGETKLIDRLELQVSPEIDYTAARVAAALGDLNLTMATGDALSGRLTATVEDPLGKPTVQFGAELQARTGEAVKPWLPLDPGPLAVALDVEGSLIESTRLGLDRMNVTVRRAGSALGEEGLVGAIELLQALRVNLDDQAFSAADPAANLARVQLGEIPLAWAEAFVDEAKLDGFVTGGVLELGFRTLDDLSVATTTQVSLQGVSATLAGQPQVSQVDMAVDFSAALKGEHLSYDVRRLGLTGAGGAALATVSAAGNLNLGETTAMSAKGTLEAEVGALARQPALASRVVLERGRVEATFDATVRDMAVDAKVNANTRGLVGGPDKGVLGDLDVVLTAKISADGEGTIDLPIVLEADGRRSDVALQGSFVMPPAATAAGGAPGAGTEAPIRFDGTVSGRKLFSGDFQAFAALMPPSSGEDAAAKPADATEPKRTIRDRLSDAATAALNVAPAPPPKRDTEPFWKGVTGQVAFDLKEVYYGKDTMVRNLRGTARISDTGIAVEGVEGRIKDDPLKVAGGITFDAKAVQPYSLVGDVDVKGFALGPLLQPANPKEKPQLETTVAVDADVKGQGGTLAELLKNVNGTFDVSGTGGVLRMLGKRGETIGKVAGLVGLFGAVKGSESTLAAAELVSVFNELKFDQFRMRVERGADLGLKFSSIEFVSPILRLSGTGSMAPQEGTEVANQPMNIVLKLGGKGMLAELLRKTGLLSGETDEQGYATMRQTFTVGGTPANADASAFWRMVTEAGLRGAAGFLGK